MLVARNPHTNTQVQVLGFFLILQAQMLQACLGSGGGLSNIDPTPTPNSKIQVSSGSGGGLKLPTDETSSTKESIQS